LPNSNYYYVSREDRAYCAGLYEGEGSIYYTVGKKPEGYRDNRQLRLTIRMNDRLPLDLFSELMIFGTVTGPYIRKPGLIGEKYDVKPEYYHYQATGLERVQFIVCQIWNWLSPRRRDQISTAIEKFHSFEVYTKPRGTWRNRSK
jgi:hypothetical protein